MPYALSPVVVMLPETVVSSVSPKVAMPYAEVPAVVMLPETVVSLLWPRLEMPHALIPVVVMLPAFETVIVFASPLVWIPFWFPWLSKQSQG